MVRKIRFESIEEAQWHSAGFAGDYFDFTSDLLLGVDLI
jgi:hypothetical protein